MCRCPGAVTDRPRGDREHEPKAGCAGSVLNLLQIAGFNHQVKIVQGRLPGRMFRDAGDFFKELREKKSEKKTCAGAGWREMSENLLTVTEIQ